LPAGTLAETVAAYNRDAAAGVDTRYGRPASMMRPLQPPYYGIALWPCLLNTQGGPRRTPDGRVIGLGGDPIPGLYSAGELGSIWAELYPGGGNLMECIVSGIAAGRSVAAEDRDDD
jgi:predicted oxidoreductase